MLDPREASAVDLFDRRLGDHLVRRPGRMDAACA
jgi:hypothetical protein